MNWERHFSCPFPHLGKRNLYRRTRNLKFFPTKMESIIETKQRITNLRLIPLFFCFTVVEFEEDVEAFFLLVESASLVFTVSVIHQNFKKKPEINCGLHLAIRRTFFLLCWQFHTMLVSGAKSQFLFLFLFF